MAKVRRPKFMLARITRRLERAFITETMGGYRGQLSIRFGKDYPAPSPGSLAGEPCASVRIPLNISTRSPSRPAVTSTVVSCIPLMQGYYAKFGCASRSALSRLRESLGGPSDLMVFDNHSCPEVRA